MIPWLQQTNHTCSGDAGVCCGGQSAESKSYFTATNVGLMITTDAMGFGFGICFCLH
jgi:hypothetical protein